MEINEKILWNKTPDQKEYQELIFQQYKLYVEMADQISARRQNANAFFLSINTALITALGYIIISLQTNMTIFSVLISICGVLLNLFWYQLIISYKNLNGCKFEIINLIEKKLPVRPYFTEWQTLDSGRNKKKYNPVTHIEKFIPFVFIFIFFFIYVWSGF